MELFYRIQAYSDYMKMNKIIGEEKDRDYLHSHKKKEIFAKKTS